MRLMRLRMHLSREYYIRWGTECIVSRCATLIKWQAISD